MLGRAKKVMIEKENTTIVNGAGKKAEIEAPHHPDQGADRGDHLGLRPREAAGAAGQARRRRRGDPRRRRDRDRGEGAQGSRRRRDARDPRRGRGRHPAGRRRRAAARRSKALKKHPHASNDDQKTGVEIVRKALSWPARQIAVNAGDDGSVVVGKILEKDQYAYGFDAQTGEYGNLVSKGIIDPTKVVRAALQDAASVAGLLITTEAMVAELPKKRAPRDAGRRRRHGRHGLLIDPFRSQREGAAQAAPFFHGPMSATLIAPAFASTQLVMAGLVPAIPIGVARPCHINRVTGTTLAARAARPVMTNEDRCKMRTTTNESRCAYIRRHPPRLAVVKRRSLAASTSPVSST